MEEYRPACVLVTGGAGFIGSHVVLQLLREPGREYKVVCLDKLDYCATKRNLQEVADHADFTFVHGDILNADLVKYVLSTHAVDTVIHLAAQSHVDNSFGNSLQFTTNNVVGTHVLLECCRDYGKIRRFVHVSTDEVYGEVLGEGARENSVLDPTNPYAASKAGAEIMAKAYHKSFGMPIIITRGNNVYGPHQYPEKLIPKFIYRLSKDMPCCIHGDGSARRMFLYVTDVARAMATIMRRGAVGEVYNIGSEDEFTVLDVARTLIRRLKGPTVAEERLFDFVEDRKFNDCRYCVDSSKLKALGWAPMFTFEEGLGLTIAWYEANRDHWDNVDRALAPHPIC